MPSWIDAMQDEDLVFIKRLILASGSLKELASIYGITYPTIRLRLDRLIEKIKVLDSQEMASKFERLLQIKYAEGKLDLDTLKAVLEVHRSELEQSKVK